MPFKARHPCNFPGCRELVNSRYCPEHERLVSQQYEMTRETAVQRGYDTRWHKVRKMKLSSAPICEACERAGKTVPATLVHHLDRNPKNNRLINLASLCNVCHDKEHAGERWRSRA